MYTGKIDSKKNAGRNREQNQCVEHECRSESPAQVLSFCDVHGVGERMHTSRHIARCYITRYYRRSHEPKESTKHHRLCDSEWGVDKEVLVECDGESAVSCHQEVYKEQGKN